MKEIKMKVFGRVQGVNFRSNVKRFSDEIDTKGNVRNMDDGSVLIVAQGSSQQLGRLINFVKSNPGLSKVQKIERKTSAAKELFSDFEIVRVDSLLIDKKKALTNLGRNLF